jgi:hypothetical protein
MTTSGWTKPPLDYVPVSRLDGATGFKPTKWLQPNPLKRASIAAVTAAVAVGVIVYVPSVALAAVAIVALIGAVHLAGKFADRLNDYDRE